jgi:hypothetical protein
MDQFGLNMNFIGIKQVSIINFVLKINFHNHLFVFTDLWTTRAINREFRVHCIKILRLSYPSMGWRVNISKTGGSLERSPTRRGITCS